MKKLIVCGCSFSAVSNKPDYINTSWSELLANKLGWDLQNIARQGCSNGGIRIQIDEVIRQRPDFAIITPTSYDRIEIPNFIKEKFKISNFDMSYFKMVGELLLPTIFQSTNKDINSYHKDAGLDNINYGNNTSSMIVETLNSLAGDWPHIYRPNQSVPEDVQKAVQMYINYLYDGWWKRQMDEWIIRDGLNQLQIHNIPFLINIGLSLWSSDKEMKDALYGSVPEKSILDDNTINPPNVAWSHPPDGATKENVYGPNDPGYHTNSAGQQFIADGFYDIIKDRWGL